MLEYAKFDLYDFQSKEVERLYKQKSRLVAWEMGTGKTYAGIALDIENRGRSQAVTGIAGGRKTLVVCPKSVIDVWDQHTMELTDLDVYVIDSKNRAKFIKDVLDGRKDGYFICHWEALRLMPELQQIPFFHIIADECHRVKNRKAQQTRALKKLRCLYKTAMSGTPADNKPQDLWSVINWLWPTVYKSYWAFVKLYCVMETSYEGYRKMVGVKNVQYLKKEMAPWYSRLLKKDVLKDLPDKYYTTVWVDLDAKQRKAYNEMQKTMVAWVTDHESEMENPIIAQAVIAQLVRLQQYALGYMVPKLDQSGKQMYNKPKWDKSIGEYKAKTPQYVMTEPSSKLDTLMSILEDNEDEQFVVFSQYKAIMPLLEERLSAGNISHGIYTGDTSQEDRAQIVRDFQAGKRRVFAGTLAAGGMGITLTSATTVVFLDRAWSPALNAQGEDRLHRIGQKNAVHVIDIMAKATVDWGRRQQLAQKMEWLRAILGDEITRKLQFNLKETYDDGA